MHALHLLLIEAQALPVLDGRRRTGLLLLSPTFHGNVPSGKKRKTARAAFHACCSLFSSALLSSTVLRLMSIGRAEAGPYLIIGIIKCSVGLKSNICKNIKCYYDSIESL